MIALLTAAAAGVHNSKFSLGGALVSSEIFSAGVASCRIQGLFPNSASTLRSSNVKGMTWSMQRRERPKSRLLEAGSHVGRTPRSRLGAARGRVRRPRNFHRALLATCLTDLIDIWARAMQKLSSLLGCLGSRNAKLPSLFDCWLTRSLTVWRPRWHNGRNH